MSDLPTNSNSQSTSSPSSRWVVAVAASLGSALVALDVTVNVALPAITADFATSLVVVQWIIIAYLATRAGLTASVGRGLDILGTGWPYGAGLALYGIGCLLSSAVPAFPYLIPSRIIQGVGATIILAAGPAMITGQFPGELRGRALSLLTAGAGLAGVAGPILGGVLIVRFGWRSIFFIRFPFSILTMLLVMLGGPVPRPKLQAQQFDWRGALLLGGALIALTLGITSGQGQGWLSPMPLSLGGVAVILFGNFVWIQPRTPQPVLHLALFQDAGFSAGVALRFVASFSTFSLWILMPFYVSQVLGFPVTILGMLFPLISGCQFILGPLGGWAADRLGQRMPSVSGLALSCLGLFTLSRAGVSAGILEIGLPLLTVGAGMAFFAPANSSAVMGGVAADRLGTGAGVLVLSQTLGSLLSVPVYSAFYSHRLHYYSMESPSIAASTAYGDAFLLAAFLSALAGLLALLAPQQLPSHKHA